MCQSSKKTRKLTPVVTLRRLRTLRRVVSYPTTRSALAGNLGNTRRETCTRLVVQVVWTRGATSELRAIRAYIAEFSPLAAQRLAARLINAARSLEGMPDRGRALSRGRRELTLIALGGKSGGHVTANSRPSAKSTPRVHL